MNEVIATAKSKGITVKYRWQGATLIGVFTNKHGSFIQRCMRLECDAPFNEVNKTLQAMLDLIGPMPREVWAQYHDQWIKTPDGALHCLGNPSSADEERLLAVEWLHFEEIPRSHLLNWTMNEVGMVFDMPRDVDEIGPVRLEGYSDSISLN